DERTTVAVYPTPEAASAGRDQGLIAVDRAGHQLQRPDVLDPAALGDRACVATRGAGRHAAARQRERAGVADAATLRDSAAVADGDGGERDDDPARMSRVDGEHPVRAVPLDDRAPRAADDVGAGRDCEG